MTCCWIFFSQEKYENATQVNGELKELLLLLKVQHSTFNQSSQFAPHQINEWCFVFDTATLSIYLLITFGLYINNKCWYEILDLFSRTSMRLCLRRMTDWRSRWLPCPLLSSPWRYTPYLLQRTFRFSRLLRCNFLVLPHFYAVPDCVFSSCSM